MESFKLPSSCDCVNGAFHPHPEQHHRPRPLPEQAEGGSSSLASHLAHLLPLEDPGLAAKAAQAVVHYPRLLPTAEKTTPVYIDKSAGK